jgi:hypothetical protein
MSLSPSQKQPGALSDGFSHISSVSNLNSYLSSHSLIKAKQKSLEKILKL